jgi:hypothetical protein
MEMGSIIGTEDIGITTTTRMKETKEHRLLASTVAQIFRAANATTPRRGIGAVVASRCSKTLVPPRVRVARLRSRVFCKIDPTWWNTLVSRIGLHQRFLLPAGGGSEISVCAAGENRKTDCQPCKGK